MLNLLLFAEPCPPRNVMVNRSCEDALVSWNTSPVAETYHAVVRGVDGHVHTCNTTSSNCSLSELHCDQQYTVFVIASHENCSSKASQNATFTTGICPFYVLYMHSIPVLYYLYWIQHSDEELWRVFHFLSVQVPVSQRVSQFRSTVPISLRCSHGQAEIML